MNPEDAPDKIGDALRLAREKREDISDEMEIRLKEIEDRARGFQKVREQKLSDQRKEEASSQEAGRGLATGLSVAYTLMGVPILGFGIGTLIDKFVVKSGNMWGGILTIVFAALALYMVVVTTNRMDSDKKSK